MYILEVIPLQKGIPRDTLSYFSARPITPGTMVEIPLNTRTITGIVIDQRSARDAKSSVRSGTFSLKSIGHVLHDQVFPQKIMETLRAISLQTYLPMGTLFMILFPEPVFDFIISWKSAHHRQSDIRTITLPTDERWNHYTTLIRESFNKGTSITIITPTVIQNEQLVNFFKKEFQSDQVVSLHGSLTAIKKEAVYKKIADETKPIIVCATPQYAIVPRNDISTYVLESTNSPYYRTNFGQSIDFRTILISLFQTLGYGGYLGDNILSSDEQFLLDTRKIFADRSNHLKKKPVIDIIEKESLSAITYQSPLFSSQTLNHIHDQLKLGKKIFVYAARKSIATVTTCRDCGYTVTCPNCSAVMQLIKKNPLSSTDRVFHCNRCQTEIPPMNRCPHCLGWNIVPLGITTESVVEELSKIFPGVTIYQSNNDLTKTESACKKMITSWENGGILVGTQKIIPFIRTADTSIIASFEHCMSIPDHTTTMTTLWLFQQILEKTTDRYLIQTNYPDQLFLQQFQQQNLQQILDDDYSLRSQYGFPPTTTLITIVMENISRRDHPQARDFLKQPLQSFENTIQSQFFEYSQTYTIQAIIHLGNRSWQESTEPSIRRLRQLLDTLRGHASITIETPWLF